MIEALECIILRVIPHSDRSVIVTCFSDRAGRVSFVTPAGNGREARRRRALMMPCAVLRCVADVKPGSLMRIRDVSRPPGLPDLWANPVKSAVAFFVADLLDSLTRQSDVDGSLYRFLRSSVDCLGAGGPVATANFHLAFMAGLIRHAGIEPDGSTYRRGHVLDLRDGVYRAAPPLHNDFLEPDESGAASVVMAMNMRNRKLFRFNHVQRNRVMDVMLTYISLHLCDIRGLRSVEILRSL